MKLKTILAFILATIFAQTAFAESNKNSLEGDLDRIRLALMPHMKVPPNTGCTDVEVEASLFLDRKGSIIKSQTTVKNGTKATRQIFEAAFAKALKKASPFSWLPIKQYDSWKEMIIRLKMNC